MSQVTVEDWHSPYWEWRLLQRITCQSNDQGVDSILQTCYRNTFNTGMALGSSFLSNNLLTTPKGVLGPRIWGSLCWIAVQTASNRSLCTEWLFMKGHFSAGVEQRRWYAAGSRARRSFSPISIYLLAIPPILLRSCRFKNELCIINKRQQLFFYSHLVHAYHSGTSISGFVTRVHGLHHKCMKSSTSPEQQYPP